jgi:hypothetical protein
MAEKTPQTEALTQDLLGSDEKLESFKNDPEPHLDRHGVSATPEERENLKNHLAKNDVGAIRMSLEAGAMHTMFSQKA